MTLNALIQPTLSLGKGEVDSSILSGSTRKAQVNRRFLTGALPFPPMLNPERTVKFPQKLGENRVCLYRSN